MPQYEYRCDKCGRVFTLQSPIPVATVKCPECDATAFRVFGTFSFVIK